MALSDDTVYGVTDTGFVRMRLPEIRKNLFDRLDAKLGAAVSRKANSILAVLIGLIAEESDRLWELAEYDYYARSPVSADDGTIDNTVMYTGVTRLTAESTYLYIVCYGSEGTELPENCQVKGDDGELYDIEAASVITLGSCVSAKLSVDYVNEGDVFTVLLDDTTLTFTASEAGDGDVITTMYNSMIAQAPDGWTGSIDDDGCLCFEYEDRRYGRVVVPVGFTIEQAGTPVKFIAANTGELDPDIGTVTTINTVYDGWESCANESDAYPGRDDETVTELRQRYASAVYRTSVGRKESLKAALLELQDVTAATVYENRSDETVDGMKPHSFWAIVTGGEETAIAEVLLNKAPLGIDSNGDIAVVATDSEGVSETIYFSRPTEVPIYVKVIVYEYDEESLSSDLVATIKSAVVTTGENLAMGKDVIAQRFIGPIYEATSGIGYLDVTVSFDGETFTDKSLSIDIMEKAAFDVERVTVALSLEEE